MAYNYAYEWKKFKEEWEQKEIWYRSEGMSEEAIHEMYILDLDEFNSTRKYYRHTLEFPVDLSLLTSLLAEMPEDHLSGRYDWVEELETPEFVHIIRNLSPDELELLTQLVEDEEKQADIARNLEITRQSVNERLQRIKKYFQKFSETT